MIKGVRVASYDGAIVTLTDGNTIPASTLIWTAGVKPSPVIAPLPCEKEHGRLLVSEFLAVTGVPGLWAAGDCAAVPVSNTEKFNPPTAQHGLREGLVAAKNFAAVVLDRPLKPFIFATLGQLATIGRRKGVAMVFGIKFSGFVAWVFWRTVYLMKLPRLPKKLRVLVGWTLDLLFARDIEQMITLRDVEALSELAGRIRARVKQQQSSLTAASTPEAAILGRPQRPFIFTTLGQLATIGRRTGVAMAFGMKFSGFVAWGLWRMVYLMKLPRLPKKLRVMVGWTLDLLFARDIEQMITMRDVEALSELAGRIRARATQQTSTTAASPLDTATRDQP